VQRVGTGEGGKDGGRQDEDRSGERFESGLDGIRADRESVTMIRVRLFGGASQRWLIYITDGGMR
jgi:hypothetical protein